MLPALARFVRALLHQRAYLAIRVAHYFQDRTLRLRPQLHQVFILVVAILHQLALRWRQLLRRAGTMRRTRRVRALFAPRLHSAAAGNGNCRIDWIDFLVWSL